MFSISSLLPSTTSIPLNAKQTSSVNIDGTFNVPLNYVEQCSSRQKNDYVKTLEDGTILKGEFKNNNLIKGTKTYPSSGQDIGTFTNGKLHGQNCIRVYPNNGHRHEGTFENDELIDGKLFYSDGVIKEGKFTGELNFNTLIKGSVNYTDGTQKIGTFTNNKLHGQHCTHIYPNNKKLEGTFKNNELTSGKITYSDGKIEIGTFKNNDLHGEKCTRIFANNETEVGTFTKDRFTKGTLYSSRHVIEQGSRNEEFQITDKCNINYFTGLRAGTTFDGTYYNGELINGTIHHKSSNTFLTVSNSDKIRSIKSYTNLDLNPVCHDLFKEFQTPLLYNQTQTLAYKTFMKNFKVHANVFYKKFLQDIKLKAKTGETIIKEQFNLNFSDIFSDKLDSKLSIILEHFHSLDEDNQDNILAFISNYLISHNLGKASSHIFNQILKYTLTQDITVFTGLRTFARVERNYFESSFKKNIIYASYLKHINRYVKKDLSNIEFSIKVYDKNSIFIYITNLDQYNKEFKDYFNTTKVISPQLILPLDRHDFEGYGFRIPKLLIDQFKNKKPSEDFFSYYINYDKSIFFEVSSSTKTLLDGKIMGEQQYPATPNLVNWKSCFQNAVELADNNYNTLIISTNNTNSFYKGAQFIVLFITLSFFLSKLIPRSTNNINSNFLLRPFRSS